MTQPETAALPPLPHWEQAPADIPAAIAQVKAALRARIAASGRTVEEVFEVVEQQLTAEVGEIVAAASEATRSGRSSTTRTSSPAAFPRKRGHCCTGVAAWWSAGTSTATRRWAGTATSWTTSRATSSSSTTGAPPTTSSPASSPSRRSTRSTGRRRRCRPGSMTGWRGCRRSSTASGSTNPTVCSGSTRPGTCCIRTGSSAGRRAPTPLASGPTSTRALSTCG